MRQYWQRYVDVFRSLVVDGWQIYKTRGSILYTWVYPYTSLPSKFKLKEANEINTIANNFYNVAGTTRINNVRFSIFYNTQKCLDGKY